MLYIIYTILCLANNLIIFFWIRLSYRDCVFRSFSESLLGDKIPVGFLVVFEQTRSYCWNKNYVRSAYISHSAAPSLTNDGRPCSSRVIESQFEEFDIHHKLMLSCRNSLVCAPAAKEPRPLSISADLTSIPS